MILSLLHELNEESDKSHKETIISGVAAAAYTGEWDDARNWIRLLGILTRISRRI